jgi:DNA-binding XRE family transcriptional regulator
LLISPHKGGGNDLWYHFHSNEQKVLLIFSFYSIIGYWIILVAGYLYYNIDFVFKSSEMLAQNLKKLRKQRKLSQEKLARLADISYNTIIKIEAGKANNPTFQTLSKLADAFGVSMDELAGRNNKKNKRI